MSRKPGDYEVGYGKPPKHSQFKKGQSGNPGRKKGSKNISTLIERELDKRVVVTEGGKRRTVTKREVIAAQLVNKAAQGDPKAIPIVLNESRQFEAEAAKADVATAFTSDKDQEVVLAWLKKVRGDDAAEGGDDI